MTDAPETSMTMIGRAKSGNEAAWSRIVDIYGPLVHSQCIAKSLPVEDAKDVTIATFKSLWESLDRFKKERETDRFLHFLRTITSRRIVDHWRREANRVDVAYGGEENWLAQHAIPLEGDLSEEQVESVWGREQLHKKLATRILITARKKFRPDTLKAFELVVIHERPVSEVAEELGKTETAIRTNVSRVKLWIQEEFGNLPEDLARLQAEVDNESFSVNGE